MKLKRNFIDKISYKGLLFILLGLTFLFSIVYFVLSLTSVNNGLVITPIRELTFWDALYYSFLVETTLGSGDIQAIGLSRLLTCTQVAFGLLIAGITVTKITSSEGRKIRYIRKYAGGYWFEPFKITNKDTMFTFSRIYYEDGEIKYSGDNYYKNGKHNDYFETDFMGHKNNKLIFMYKNPIKRNLFDEGIMEVTFYNTKMKSNSNWNHHKAVNYDHQKGEKTIFWGWRAEGEELQKFLNGTIEQKTEIIKKYIDKFEDCCKEEEKDNS